MVNNSTEIAENEERQALYNCGSLPNCISDQMVRKAEQRLRNFAPWDEKIYVSRYPDVAVQPLNPAEHLIRFGCFEGRKEALSRARIANLLRNLKDTADEQSLLASTVLPAAEVNDSIRDQGAKLPAVGVFFHSKGSRLFKEFAQEIFASFQDTEIECSLLTEESPINGCPPIPIFVGPHEFFVIGRGPEWIRDDILQKAIIFNVEQVQTEWFLRGMPFLLMAKAVIDLSLQSAFILKQCGIPSMHLSLASKPGEPCLSTDDFGHPFLLSLPRAAREHGDVLAPLRERCVDISFFATSSPRRESFMAANAEFFSKYQAFLYYRRDSLRGAVKDNKSEQSLNRLCRHISRHSKISLNIHRDDNKYFEWHRIVRLAMDSNALVVSEPCLPHPLFHAGTHYLEENRHSMADRIKWLLETPDGMKEAERVRNNAFNLLETQYRMRSSTLQLVRFLAQLNKQPNEPNSVVP